MRFRVFVFFLLPFVMSACSPLDVAKAIIPQNHDPLLSVKTQVGDNQAAVGQTQTIRQNQGVAIGHDQYNGTSLNVQQDTPADKILLYTLLGFLAGFLIGWPMPQTPQKIIAKLLCRRHKGETAALTS